LKVGEGNPQAREEEGKLCLLSMEHSSSLAGVPRIWGSEFHGKATAFTSPYQPEHCPQCSLGSALHPWLPASHILDQWGIDSTWSCCSLSTLAEMSFLASSCATHSSCTHSSIGIDSVATLRSLGGALPSIAL